MTQEKYYGTIIHWFNDMQRGSIMPDNLGQRIFADGLSLAAHYLQPRSGDRVCFNIDSKQRSAQNVEPLNAAAKSGEKAIITIREWDFMQNAGFGTQAGNPGQPIFILGEFLADQSRVPDTGDQFEGTLLQDENGRWTMADAVLLQAATAADTFQTASTDDTPETDIAAGDQDKTPSKALQPAPQPTGAAPHQPQFEESIYKLYKAPEPQTLVMLPTNQLLSGTIISWDDTKGYGFIRFGNKSQKVFFHISAFHYATSRPKIGQSVSFYCKKTVEGERQKAAKVVLRGDEVFLFDDFPSDYNRPYLSTANMPYFFTNSLIAAAFAVFVGLHSKILLGLYFVLSIASYFMYKFDKQIAQTRKKKNDEYQGRIPEKNLHILDVCGGWPGALVSRAVYRHKTSKASFIRIFWLTVAINIAITYALLIHYADNPLLSLLRN
ncbi:DUF1294 domain-containing protein [Neisseria sp. CCUG12390]|uniref:DUF1294 domain-containing protein n=1 Tax=Neisseria sp. CCUG12390 TaxID=3392035 RepID=UPI003A100B00